MKVILVQDTNIHLFRHLFLGSVIQKKTILLGCVEGDTVLGTAAFERFHFGGSVSWLYVLPEHRRKGAGGLLLQEIFVLADGLPVEINYDSAPEWAEDLSFMLMRRGFIVTATRLPSYRLTADQLRSSSMLHSEHEKPQNESSIHPLAELSSHQLRTLVAKSEADGAFYISRADYGSYDAKLSMVCMVRDQVFGMMLVKNLGDGVLELSLMYLEEKHPMWGLPMIRRTVQNALEQVSDLKEVTFTCAAETAEKLAARLVPEAEKTWVSVTNALLVATVRKHGLLKEV